MKSFQETFDEILIHMRARGYQKATREADGLCVYRLDNGDKGCFIGALIRDEDYNHNMEATGCDGEMVGNALIKEGYDPTFCTIFQVIHDKFNESRWEEIMEIIARDLGLSYHRPEGFGPLGGYEIYDAPTLLAHRGSRSAEYWAQMFDTFKRQIEAQKITVQVIRKASTVTA